ncbi:MAG: ClbS/DfsB family four-helix bundle protein [Bacilli bacterium]
MARATTKADLIKNALTNYDKLNELIKTMSENELNEPFDFSNDERKCEAHWNRDKNLRDVYIHLYEWHQLVLNWVQNNLKGNKVSFLPSPYNWKTYGDMNVEFWKKHQQTDLDKAKQIFIKSHNDILELVEKFTSEELFTKDSFDWVGGSTLGSYFVSATSSHYEWAIKKLKAHKRRLKNETTN